MKTTEIRVRPTVRYVVTRFTSEVMEDGRGSGSSECLGEFGHESYAEEVAAALQKEAAQREYVMVQETMGEIMAKVFYASSEAEVQAFLTAPRPADESYCVYSRIKPRID